MAEMNKIYYNTNRVVDSLLFSKDKQEKSIKNTKETLESYAAKKGIRILKFHINDAISDVSIGPSNITLCEFIVEHKKLMKGQISHTYLKDQLRALRFLEDFIGGSTLLKNIHSRDAEAYISMRLSSEVSIATVNKDIRTLRRIFNLAIEPRGYLPEKQNPFNKIKQRKKSSKQLRYVTVQEYKQLLASTNSLWWKALIAVAYGSGLRRAEILNLTWSDIDFENRQLKVTPKQQTENTLEWEPKDHEMRIIPMTDQTFQFLSNLQISCPAGHLYPFISLDRFNEIKEKIKQKTWNPVLSSHTNLMRDFNVIQRVAGISKCTLHDLRRSAITNWGQSLPIHVVQQFAGHSDINTTRKYYLMVRDEDMEKASKVMNNILEEVKNDKL